MLLRGWSQVLGLVCCVAGCARPDAPRATDSSSPKAAPAVAIDNSLGSAPDAAPAPPVVDRRIFAKAANSFGFDLYGKVHTVAGNVVVARHRGTGACDDLGLRKGRDGGADNPSPPLLGARG